MSSASPRIKFQQSRKTLPYREEIQARSAALATLLLSIEAALRRGGWSLGRMLAMWLATVFVLIQELIRDLLVAVAGWLFA